MKYSWSSLTCAAGKLLCNGQSGAPSDRFGLTDLLSFEIVHSGASPAGWDCQPEGTIFVDNVVVHSGRRSARLEANSERGAFSRLSKAIPIDFKGKLLELRGFLRTEKVSGFVGLWVLEDGCSPALAFDNMHERQLNGTTGWVEYSIQLPLHPEAQRLVFGVLLAGTGKAWVDDLQLLVDGKPVWETKKIKRPENALAQDHEFDHGSGIALNDLDKDQIENLVTLGKVWGFLKYHHPVVTSGKHHWDYELFRVLPGILAAGDKATANAVILRWINGLGKVREVGTPATLDQLNIHLRPRLDWLADDALLGKELSENLLSIYTHRPSRDDQFYVALAAGVGNAVFLHELSYDDLKLPDPAFQLLSVYRFWNIIEYWFPYRDMLSDDWDTVLAKFIPRIALAKSPESYQSELMALIARAHDSHANLWSSLHIRPPVGPGQLPVKVRFIEKQAVITGYTDAAAAKTAGLEIGDIITHLDGMPVRKIVEDRAPYYPASNDAGRLRDLAHSLTGGACCESTVRVSRNGSSIDLPATRIAPASSVESVERTHDLPGETFRLLDDQVAYLKASSILARDVARYIKQSAGTKGLIIDLRNYPSEFVVFELGPLLVNKTTPFARFTYADLNHPGAFHWTQPISLVPSEPHYTGKVIILVDEMTQSQAEYTTMAFRVAPGAVVIGNTTAGADGNVSPFSLPGGLSSMISGIGVFYPDKTPTQRFGIIPDIKVRPTIAGIRAGRDEVLEQALCQVIGPGAAAALSARLQKP
jgi:hypothetical protein